MTKGLLSFFQVTSQVVEYECWSFVLILFSTYVMYISVYSFEKMPNFKLSDKAVRVYKSSSRHRKFSKCFQSKNSIFEIYNSKTLFENM